MPSDPLRVAMYMVPVDVNYCVAIGNVIIQWGHLDRTYNEVIEIMMRKSETPPEKGWERWWPWKKTDLFKAQARLCFSDHSRIIDELDAIKLEIDSYQIDRHLLAHGQYATTFPGGGGPITLRVKGRVSNKEYERNYSLEFLREMYGKICLTHGRLIVFRHGDADDKTQPGWTRQEIAALRDLHSSSQ